MKNKWKMDILKHRQRIHFIIFYRFFIDRIFLTEFLFC